MYKAKIQASVFNKSPYANIQINLFKYIHTSV